jgi:catechol 2,3-dioxygenase-like lactoylglutathione lyase family enzyme
VVGIDHLDLVVDDLDSSLEFYRGLLGPMGWTREVPIVGERGEHVVYLGARGIPSISLREAQSEGEVDRYGIGLHHLAIGVESRAVVDERTEWLRSVGAEIESGPREYDYVPGYYAVFFRDPSGIKLEIVHKPP